MFTSGLILLIEQSAPILLGMRRLLSRALVLAGVSVPVLLSQQSSSPKPVPDHQPVGRFLPLVPPQGGAIKDWSLAFALDSKLGAVCKTHILDKDSDPYPGMPLCSELLRSYPN
jgi:hypothetical protein